MVLRIFASGRFRFELGVHERACMCMCTCAHTCAFAASVQICIAWFLPVHVCIVCLSVCLPACLPVCLPTCLPVCLPTCLPACLSVCLSVCPPARPRRVSCVCTCLQAMDGVGVGHGFVYPALPWALLFASLAINSRTVGLGDVDARLIGGSAGHVAGGLRAETAEGTAGLRSSGGPSDHGQDFLVIDISLASSM